MNRAKLDSASKEKVLKMLASLTPRAGIALLEAALEQKALREDVHKSESQEEERVRCTLISK